MATDIAEQTPVTLNDDAERLAAFLAGQPQHGLSSTILNDARVQPMRGVSGGVCLGSEWDALRQQRGWKPADSFDDCPGEDTIIEGEYIYGGPMGHLHFGHVMAEFVHRIVPSLQRFGSGRFLFVAREGARTGFAQQPHWFQDILGFLGLGAHNTLIVNAACRVERLRICQQGSCLGGPSEKSYLDLLQAFSEHRLAELGHSSWNKHAKVYVSRSRVPHGGNFLGERYMEKLLHQRGFHILYPETVPFVQQIWTYAHAQQLIFCEGSAAHGCELLGTRSLNEVLLIGKRELGTYTRVLAPRSKKFHAQKGHRLLGSLVRNANGSVVIHRAIHLFDVPHLLSDLREKMFADLEPLFDAAAYEATVKEDLYSYMAYCLQRPRAGVASPTEIADFLMEFDRAPL